jgi:hypothetical protein
MKTRDEMKVTIAAYKSLYESSIIFGIRKQVQAEEGVKEMEDRTRELERKKNILENQVSNRNGRNLSSRMNWTPSRRDSRKSIFTRSGSCRMRSASLRNKRPPLLIMSSTQKNTAIRSLLRKV